MDRLMLGGAIWLGLSVLGALAIARWFKMQRQFDKRDTRASAHLGARRNGGGPHHPAAARDQRLRIG